MEKALEIITNEIAEQEMRLGQLREAFDFANDNNRVQEQIDCARGIADAAARISALKRLEALLKTAGR